VGAIQRAGVADVFGHIRLEVVRPRRCVFVEANIFGFEKVWSCLLIRLTTMRYSERRGLSRLQSAGRVAAVAELGSLCGTRGNTMNAPETKAAERKFCRWAGYLSPIFMAVPLLALRLAFFSDALFCFFAAIGLFLAVAGLIRGGWISRICAVLAFVLVPPSLFQFLHHHY